MCLSDTLCHGITRVGCVLRPDGEKTSCSTRHGIANAEVWARSAHRGAHGAARKVAISRSEFLGRRRGILHKTKKIRRGQFSRDGRRFRGAPTPRAAATGAQSAATRKPNSQPGVLKLGEGVWYGAKEGVFEFGRASAHRAAVALPRLKVGAAQKRIEGAGNRPLHMKPKLSGAKI